MNHALIKSPEGSYKVISQNNLEYPDYLMSGYSLESEGSKQQMEMLQVEAELELN